MEPVPTRYTGRREDNERILAGHSKFMKNNTSRAVGREHKHNPRPSTSWSCEPQEGAQYLSVPLKVGGSTVPAQGCCEHRREHSARSAPETRGGRAQSVCGRSVHCGQEGVASRRGETLRRGEDWSLGPGKPRVPRTLGRGQMQLIGLKKKY